MQVFHIIANILTYIPPQTGKKIIKLEISSVRKNTADNKKSTKRSLTSSALEFELDELRKELASISGGILPHSVLSSQLIRLISARKPSTMEEASSNHVNCPFKDA